MVNSVLHRGSLVNRFACNVMWLHVSVKYTHGKIRRYRFFGTTLEDLMEVLNYFVGQGLELQSAFLTDAEGRRTELPVASFDGGVVSEKMRRLETEYQTLFKALSMDKNRFSC